MLNIVTTAGMYRRARREWRKECNGHGVYCTVTKKMLIRNVPLNVAQRFQKEHEHDLENMFVNNYEI